MNHFEYSAQNIGGSAIRGTLESKDSTAAMEQLESMGLRNIELRAISAPPTQRRLGRDDFIFFNEQLASLAGAGVCLDEGLRQLGQDVQSSRLRSVLEAMAGDVAGGRSLPEALERHAAQMPPLYARVVRAGIENGHLPATLLNLSNHLRLIADTRRLLAETLTYPAIVLILAVLLFSGLLMFIVPQFAETFEDFGVPLPALTMILTSLSRVLPAILIGVAILILLAWLGLAAMQRSAAGRLWRERLALRTPLVGSLIRNSLQARFLRSMAFAVDAAVPLPEAMRLSGASTGSATLTLDTERVAEDVEKGASVEQACRQSGVLPAMFGYFVGLRSDAMSLRDGLLQLAKACEARATQSQLMLRGWMAPAAIFGVGLAVGLLIVALFMPLVGLVQSVTGG